MTIILGLIITLGCMLGGFAAMGGHIGVLWQPYEYIVILGAALGTFVVANPLKTIKDAGKGLIEAFMNAKPKSKEYLEVLGLLFSFMRDLRTKPRNEVEAQVEDPEQSETFKRFPTVLKNEDLAAFICDYVRLIIIGNARTHEIEALMDEEIQTIKHDTLKAYHSMVAISESLPALGIVAAVLGVIHAMDAITESPEVLGHMIGAALVGTFAGIFISYSVMSPIATQMKIVREKRMRLYVVVKQTLLAFMNGAMPQVALEHGRKTISAYERPSIDEVESETRNAGSGARKEAA